MHPFIHRLLVFPTALAFVALAGCGGGGGGNENDPIDLVLTSLPNLDGGLTFNNVGSVDSGASTGAPLVGDGSFQPSGGTLQYQGIWSFQLPDFPAGAVIQSATLRLVQVGTGNDPQSAFVLARLDHLNFGNTFPATSGAAFVEAVAIAQLNDLNSLGPKTLDVTAAVQDDADSNRAYSQFRLRTAIATNNDANSDFMVMTDGENSNPDLRPTLLITYVE
jgi:hypothetical protein